MSTLTQQTTAVTGNTITAAVWNDEFSNIYNDYNGGITNANISASAAIATSKINATFPTGTIVGTTDTQTLTNKTLTKPTIDGSIQGTASYTPSAGGTATLNLSADNIHYITMPAGNITIALSNDSVGQVFEIRILQDSGGSRTVTWFSGITWATAAAPTLTTTASRADTFGFIVRSAGAYDGYTIGLNV